jgi:hypothetical protein
MAAMESEGKQFALQSQLQNEQIKDQLIARRSAQLDLQEKERMVTPQAFNMYSLAPKGRLTDKYVYNNPEVMGELRQVLDPDGKMGIKFSRADGLWKDPEGGTFAISPNRISELAPALTGIIERRVDTMPINIEKYAALENQRQSLTSAIRPTAPRGRGDDFGTKQRNAKAKTQIAAIDGEMNKLRAALSPAAQLEHYRNLKNRQSQRAGWASGLGHKGMTNYFTQAMSEAADLEKVALQKYLSSIGEGKGTKGQPVQKYAVRIVNGRMVPGAIKVMNVPKNIPSGMIPQTLDSSMAAADGWQWLEGAKAIGSGSSDSDKSATIVTILDKYYGAQKPGSDEWVITEENAGKYRMAVNIAGKMYKNFKGEKNLATIASEASQIADQKSIEYASMYNEVMASADVTPEEKDEMKLELVQELVDEYGLSQDYALFILNSEG